MKRLVVLLLLLTVLIGVKISYAQNGFEQNVGSASTPIEARGGAYNTIDTPSGTISSVGTDRVETIYGTWSDIDGSSTLVFENGNFVSGTITSSKDGNVIKIKDKTFTLNKGDSITRMSDGSFEVKRAQRIETTYGNQRVTATSSSNGRIDSQGNYRFDSIQDLSHGTFRVVNGVNVEFNNGLLTASQAETFLQENTIASNINNLKAKTEKFSVGEASKVVSGCNSFDNVKNSEFEVKGDDVKVTTSSNVTLNITDCSYRDIEFESKGNGSSVTIKKDKYEISKGGLKCGSKDFVDTNESASIEMGSDCFICLTINPPGTYFYSDADIRKDFNINVPKESSTYKLCLRKNSAQQFTNYNGLVDFVNIKIELNGIVNYLRYPLKNNQISSLLSSFVYKGLKDINIILSYDNNLIFLNNIFVNNKNNIKKDVLSITYPSNYYTIKEMEVDGEIHSIVTLNLDLKKEDLTENINYEYGTDYFGVKVSIINNTLFQQKGDHKLIIYPPGHRRINEILDYVKK